MHDCLFCIKNTHIAIYSVNALCSLVPNHFLTLHKACLSELGKATSLGKESLRIQMVL